MGGLEPSLFEPSVDRPARTMQQKMSNSASEQHRPRSRMVWGLEPPWLSCASCGGPRNTAVGEG
eukprot:572267-Alexandrium_andersonii.AAC.1